MSKRALTAAAWWGGLILIDQCSKLFLPTHFINTRLNSLFLAGGGIILLFIYRRAFTPSSLLAARSSLITLTAGGLSNLLDRLFWGGVRDIFTLGPLQWNVADLYIVSGVAAWFYVVWSERAGAI